MWDYLFIYVFKIKWKLKCISFLSDMLFSMIKNETLILSIPCMCAQSYPTLCNPVGCSLPGSSVHGIFQQEYWSGLLCPSPGDLSNPGIEPVSPVSPALQVDSLLLSHLGSPVSSLAYYNVSIKVKDGMQVRKSTSHSLCKSS